MKIGIIGSGLAAVSVAQALIERGVKPIILDYGRLDESDNPQLASELASKSPQQWSVSQKRQLFSNGTAKFAPKKLSFGSDYFYGTSLEKAPLQFEGALPPFSYAAGGLSAGWGAAALPPDDCDLRLWPIKSVDLAPYFRQVLSSLPYSAANDNLSKKFPLYTEDNVPLTLTEGNQKLLGDLTRAAAKFEQEEILFGQARVLTRAETSSGLSGCKFCGQCMSGCVYGCIYTAAETLQSLVRLDKVEYRKGVLVDSLTESSAGVDVFAFEGEAELRSFRFDKVFLAAGALNSTRIVMKSKNLFNQTVSLLTTNGFLAPLLRLRGLEDSWPNSNTQPSIFLEYKVPGLSEHWVHSQISTPNELIYGHLGLREPRKSLISVGKKLAIRHTVIAMSNMHSDHANRYQLNLKRAGQRTVLYSKLEQMPAAKAAVKATKRRFSAIAGKAGWHMISPLVITALRGGSFHVGGTLPMQIEPDSELSTNLLGNPTGWKRIHLVDSSVFPSLPATTVGLLAMANARRIGTEVDLD